MIQRWQPPCDRLLQTCAAHEYKDVKCPRKAWKVVWAQLEDSAPFPRWPACLGSDPSRAFPPVSHRSVFFLSPPLWPWIQIKQIPRRIYKLLYFKLKSVFYNRFHQLSLLVLDGQNKQEDITLASGKLWQTFFTIFRHIFVLAILRK